MSPENRTSRLSSDIRENFFACSLWWWCCATISKCLLLAPRCDSGWGCWERACVLRLCDRPSSSRSPQCECVSFLTNCRFQCVCRKADSARLRPIRDSSRRRHSAPKSHGPVLSGCSCRARGTANGPRSSNLTSRCAKDSWDCLTARSQNAAKRESCPLPADRGTSAEQTNFDD